MAPSPPPIQRVLDCMASDISLQQHSWISLHCSIAQLFVEWDTFKTQENKTEEVNCWRGIPKGVSDLGVTLVSPYPTKANGLLPAESAGKKKQSPIH